MLLFPAGVMTVSLTLQRKEFLFRRTRKSRKDEKHEQFDEEKYWFHRMKKVRFQFFVSFVFSCVSCSFRRKSIALSY